MPCPRQRLALTLRRVVSLPPLLALDEVTGASAAQLSALLGRGALGVEQAVEHYLTRIAELDHQGPRLRAVIELNPDALRIARERDRERAAGQPHGALHGLPVLLKDNI